MTIVSFKHNFIFIKTSKTAGTSIEIELSKRVEDDAIVTPISPNVEGHRARNFKRGFLRRSFHSHIPASLVRRYLGEGTYNRMFKFCVEREPVSKCMSHFHMKRNSPLHNGNGKYQKDWAQYCAERDFPIDIEKYSDGENGDLRKIVDVVIPYEDLQSALAGITEMLGIREFRLEATAKSEYSKNTLVSGSDVTEQQRIVIYQAFDQSLSVSGLKDYYANRPSAPRRR
jgi:hypothetical protein